MPIFRGSGKNLKRRFIAATETKMMYYYAENEFSENKMPLGYFLHRNINEIECMPAYSIGGKQFLIQISVSSFFKKDHVKPGRAFYFNCNNREEMLNWIVTINFLKLKATYDEFVRNYGFTELPLSFDKKNIVSKKYKKTFKLSDSIKRTGGNYRDIYANLARKSFATEGKKSVKSSDNFNFSKSFMSPGLVRREEIMKETKENDYAFNLKEVTKNLFNQCFVTFVDYIQKNIFGFEEFTIDERKVITVPKFLHKLIEDDDSLLTIKGTFVIKKTTRQFDCKVSGQIRK